MVSSSAGSRGSRETVVVRAPEKECLFFLVCENNNPFALKRRAP